MAGFLAGLGAALTEGSSLSARARAERRQADLDRQQREMELARMALERRRADLAEQDFAAGQEDREYGRVKDILEVQGPNTEIDDALASRAEKVGLGGRLTPAGQQTLESRPFGLDETGQVTQTVSPAQARPRQVRATFEQEGVLADRQFQGEDRTFQRGQRETQRRAQDAVNQPGFWRMPATQKAVVWGQTGFGGQLPESFEEWQAKQNYEQKNAMARIGAQAAAFSPQRTEWVIRNGVPTPVNSTRDYLPGDRPYDPVADRQANKPTGGGTAGIYADERALRITDALGRLRGDVKDPKTGAVTKGNRIGLDVVGIGSLGTYIPGSGATDFGADLDFLKSNIGFKELQEMRDASKTGGALGQISDTENRLLQSALGALDQRQSPESFERNLAQVESSLARWEQAKKEYGEQARPTFNGAPVQMPAGQSPTAGGELDCTQRDPRTGKLTCR